MKKVFALLVAMTLVLLLAACGKDTGSAGADGDRLTAAEKKQDNTDAGKQDTADTGKQETAENGTIAAVLIDNEVTLKRFYKEKDRFRLHPENKEMQDIITENAVILGVLTGLIRRY